MVMIVMGGIEYMTSEMGGEKQAGKDKIVHAVMGVVLALGSWLILNTINPKLLSVCLDLPKAEIVLEDEPHEAVGGKYCSNPSYNASSSWDGTPSTIPSDVTVNNGECTYVGQKNCTSLKGLNTSIVYSIKSTCPNCQLRITGGTECWLHSKVGSHKVNSSTIDLSSNSSLNTYITGNSSFPTYSSVFIKNGIKFLSEQSGQTGNTTGAHWHVSI
jgi:hypothetical protein